MLAVGQYVTDAHTGKVVKVIGVQHVFGMTTYQVYDADTGDIYKHFLHRDLHKYQFIAYIFPKSHQRITEHMPRATHSEKQSENQHQYA